MTWTTKCECGCGDTIVQKAWRKPSNPQQYVMGHQNKFRTYQRVAPRPDQIPSGICGCGCGGETAIAVHTDTRVGRFAGYPARFIQGHSLKVRAEKHQCWKGGRIKSSSGYVMVKSHDHPNKNSGAYVAEHRIVMERYLGRYLTADENVHHINGVRDDNRLENLELWTTSQPMGQRVEDKVAWAKETLLKYAPDLLAATIS